MAVSLWSMLRRTTFLVICLDTLVTGSYIRLYGGTSQDMGFVQVADVEGDWKIICNEDWDALDALVACRQLGFTNGYAMLWRDRETSYNYMNYESAGSESLVTEKQNFPLEGNNFACNGTEKALLSCRYNKDFNNYCQTSAGVACGITEAKFKELIDNIHRDYGDNLDYSTLGGSNGRVLATQRLHLYYRSSNSDILAGGICDMDEQAARLICEGQGYRNGGKAIQVPTITNLPMLLSEMSCDGLATFYECSKVYTNDGICPDGIHYNGVKCYTSLRPSVIGALAFAGVSCIFLIIAGAVGIHWIRRKAKTPNSGTINLNVGEQCNATPRQPLHQSA